ncbi:MAG: hypothetical protein GX589_03905, partial [Deltaproteobacteria bacterium]|nr:hypothetical protein [Deltaproteobacteria bacterium]
MAKKKVSTKEKKSVGGVAFFLSLFSLIVISLLNLVILPTLIDVAGLKHLGVFLSGSLIGAWAATFISKRSSVFIHELKHHIPSHFAKNKSKGWKIKDDSGEYRYSYSAASEKYNALIALSPYFFPLFTLVAILIAATTLRHSHIAMVLTVGIGYGADCLLNLKDISRAQSDITCITGGYRVGLTFIVAMHVALATILAAWILQGLLGLQYLFAEMWSMMVHIVA